MNQPRYATGEEEYFATGEYEIGEQDVDYIASGESGMYEIGQDDDDEDEEEEELGPEEAEFLLDALTSGWHDEYDGGDGGGGAGARRRGFLRRGRGRPRGRISRRRPRRRMLPRRISRTMPAPLGGFVVQKKDPRTARVLLLGFDSGADVAAGGAATVTEQPQDVFSPRRAVIPATVAPSFTVSDIKVGNISQLSSSGAIPGEMFLPDTTFSDLKFDTAQVSQQIVWTVNNITLGAVRFRAGMLGYVARL